MFKMSGNSKLRGSGHLILNVLRALSIIGLLSVAVASWVMIVKAGLSTQFFFFDAAAHFFTSIIAILLIVSELNLMKAYFRKTWPVLTESHGFTWLGVAMIIMGCQVLGNLNKPAASVESLGLPLWRLVLASGILAITFGFCNVIASFIFRDGKEGITARMIRSDGQLASAQQSKDAYYDYNSERTASIRQEKRGTKFNFKFPVRSSKLKISKPIPQDQDIEQQTVVDDSGDTWAEDRASPIVPDLKRPPTALHPAYTAGSSRYSEASHLPRF